MAGYKIPQGSIPYAVQTNMPEWKRRGYKSEQEFIDATSGANGNKIPTTVKTPTLQSAYGSLLGGGKNVTSEGAIVGNPDVNNSTFSPSTPKAPSNNRGNTGSLLTSKPSVSETPTTPTGTAPQNNLLSKYGSSYQGNNFLEWWKHHYGKDYDGSSIVKTGNMTDEDVAIGRSLLNSYNIQRLLTNQYNQNVKTETDKYQGLIDSSGKAYDSQLAEAQNEYDRNMALLLENYNRNAATAKDIYGRNTADLLKNYQTAQNALANSKRQSQQGASITLDKLKKYLPTQIKAQGLGGLGVSETSALQAYNNYNNTMGAIESNYQENKSKLDTNYNTNKNSYDTQYQKTQGDLDAAYGEGKTKLGATLDSTKSGINLAKEQASDTYNAQLADTLSKLKNYYDENMYASDKDASGNLLVDNVLEKYANLMTQEQDKNFSTAWEALKNAVYTNSEEMNAFVEQYRGKVSDEQFNALLQEGANRANISAEAARHEEEAARQEEQGTIYSEFMSRIELGVGVGYNTSYELERDYNKIKDSLTETQRQVVEGYINTIKNSTEQKQIDSDYYKNAFYLNGEAMSQDDAEKTLASILNSETDNAEKNRYQEAFDSLYADSYYNTSNKNSTSNIQQFSLYQEMANKGMSETELAKVDPDSIRTSRPFGEGEFYYIGKDGWYCWTKGGVDYWYKLK